MAKIIVLTGTLKQSGSATWAINLTRAFCQTGHKAVLLAMGERGEMALPDDLNAVFLGKSRSHFLVQLCHLLQLRKLSKSRYKRLEQWMHSRRVAQFLKEYESDGRVDLVIKDFTTFTPFALGDRNHLAVIHQMLSSSNNDSELQLRAKDKVSAFAAVSKASATDAQSKGIPVKGVLYNPIDIKDIQQRSTEFKVNDDYIIFVGALYKNKGVHILLEAWYQSGIVQKLYYVGRGPEKQSLEEKVKALGVEDRVKFLGFQSNPMPYIQQAKVLVLPSLCYETMGYVALEAIALNTPVLVSGFAGCDEFYSAECTVSLLPENTLAERLTKRIRLLLEEEYDFSYSRQKLLMMQFDVVIKNYLSFKDE